MAFHAAVAGAQGAQGPQGSAGATGAQGSTGITGSQGPQGNNGAQGAQGAAGASGPQGTAGSTGATGSQGSTGAQGPQGVGGAAASIPSAYDTVTGISTVAAALEDMTGLSTTVVLAQTAAITAVMTVNTNVSVSLASVGGFAISIDGVDSSVMTQAYFGLGAEETVTVVFERTLAAGTYTIKGRFYRVSGVGTINVDLAQLEAIGLQGAQGAQGSTGSAGPQGATGSTGATGAQGTTGAQGPQGNTGATGTQGSTGAQGVTGAQGSTGATGAQGATGTQGSTGAQGTQGVQGATGATGPQGTQGTTGAQGTQGSTGSTGAQGTQGTQGVAGSNATAVQSFFYTVGAVTNDYGARPGGFSDATTKLISVDIHNGTNSDNIVSSVACSNDIGNAVLFYQQSLDSSATRTVACGLHIGTDYWTSDDGNGTAGNRIQKNGSNVTISGTAPSANPVLGHDPTNSYLLVMDTSTRVRRYSGIAGTTITFVDSITLDTAVSNDCGFLFDNTNSRYICVDLPNNLLRRFNSSGTTVDTVSYTVSDTNVFGICMISNRVYLVVMYSNTVASFGTFNVWLVPTNMTR